MEHIYIEDGDMFSGSWEQLTNCFGIITEVELQDFCINNDVTYRIVEETPEIKVIDKLYLLMEHLVSTEDFTNEFERGLIEGRFDAMDNLSRILKVYKTEIKE